MWRIDTSLNLRAYRERSFGLAHENVAEREHALVYVAPVDLDSCVAMADDGPKEKVYFNNKEYDNWSEARVKFDLLRKQAKPDSVWSLVYCRPDDHDDPTKPFELRCK
jgi:hypothetical protein